MEYEKIVYMRPDVDLVENKDFLQKQVITRSGHIAYFDKNLTKYYKDGVSYCYKFNLCLIADIERYEELGADKHGSFTVDRCGVYNDRMDNAFSCLDIVDLYDSEKKLERGV